MLRQASLCFSSIQLLPNPPALALILRHYVQSSLHLFDRSSMAKQNLSHRANVVSDGSPSRIRIVRRISLGMTTLPRSSILLTIPVAFIYFFLLCMNTSSVLLFAAFGRICGAAAGRKGKNAKKLTTKRPKISRTMLTIRADSSII